MFLQSHHVCSARTRAIKQKLNLRCRRCIWVSRRKNKLWDIKGQRAFGGQRCFKAAQEGDLVFTCWLCYSLVAANEPVGVCHAYYAPIIYRHLYYGVVCVCIHRGRRSAVVKVITLTLSSCMPRWYVYFEMNVDISGFPFGSLSLSLLITKCRPIHEELFEWFS